MPQLHTGSARLNWQGIARLTASRAGFLGLAGPGMPAYVGLPSAQSVYLFPGYMGAAYLGPAYNPFDVDREHRYLGATYNVRIGSPRILNSLSQAQPGRMEARVSLTQTF